MSEKLLRIHDVSAILSIPLSTAYKLAREKKLPGFKVGKHWRFKPEDMEVWLDDASLNAQDK